jgi:putative SOS response-associated peptidase YedK
MCGRVRLCSDVSEIKLVFSIPPHRPTVNFPPSWNVALTDSLSVVRYDAKAGERSLGRRAVLGQGHQSWLRQINAKAEGTETRPAFREAFQRRRCLAPVDNFYGAKTTTGKQPYAIALANRSLMALAGLRENWKSPAGEWMHFRHHHHHTERAMRAAARPHARGPETRSLDGLARRRTGGGVRA